MTESTDAMTVLAGHQGQMERLVGMETELDMLRAREVDLEVDALSAEAHLSKLDRTLLGIDAASASALLAVRARRQKLQAAMEGPDQPDEDPVPRWEQGKAELAAWLNAMTPSEPTRGVLRIRTVMSMLTLAALIAGFTVHLAFLILLVPIGATSALQWSGDDGSWKRMGFKRAFDATGLQPPSAWEEAPVRERIAELERAIADHRSALEALEEDSDIANMTDEAIAMELVDKELAEQSLSSRNGIDFDALDNEQRILLEALAQNHDIERQLADTKRRHARLGDEAETVRSRIYRYLQQQGVLETSGAADIETLRKGLARVQTGTEVR